jgi:hypothetical protein
MDVMLRVGWFGSLIKFISMATKSYARTVALAMLTKEFLKQILQIA